MNGEGFSELLWGDSRIENCQHWQDLPKIAEISINAGDSLAISAFLAIYLGAQRLDRQCNRQADQEQVCESAR